MIWEKTLAKNGEDTLFLNKISLYSSYNPINDAIRWVKSEIDKNAEGYILIGLGLGYHLRALFDEVPEKNINVYYFDEKELELFQQVNKENWWKRKNIKISNNIEENNFNEKIQILIPNVWVKAIGQNHALFKLMNIIKMNQLSYKRFKNEMSSNFDKNLNLKDSWIYPSINNKIACLVSSGPSLDNTIGLLKGISEKIDVYVVGSALKKVLEHKIIPKGVIISDPQNSTLIQFENLNYSGNLYYLSTASNQVVAECRGKRYILFQNGYNSAKEFAIKNNIPLIETGGSVATVGFSLIEMLGYSKLILFGQDFGFEQNITHSTSSTSKKIYEGNENLSIVSNNGGIINTLPNLMVYHQWFEEKIKTTNLKVYSTAENGAKINGVPFVNSKEVKYILKN